MKWKLLADDGTSWFYAKNLETGEVFHFKPPYWEKLGHLSEERNVMIAVTRYDWYADDEEFPTWEELVRGVNAKLHERHTASHPDMKLGRRAGIK
jgi:hypothetical protein